MEILDSSITIQMVKEYFMYVPIMLGEQYVMITLMEEMPMLPVINWVTVVSILYIIHCTEYVYQTICMKEITLTTTIQ